MERKSINFTNRKPIPLKWWSNWRTSFTDKIDAMGSQSNRDIAHWQHAPEWANYRAQDSDGQWFWFENKPTKGSTCWILSLNEGKVLRDFSEPNWENSLEERPTSISIK